MRASSTDWLRIGIGGLLLLLTALGGCTIDFGDINDDDDDDEIVEIFDGDFFTSDSRINEDDTGNAVTPELAMAENDTVIVWRDDRVANGSTAGSKVYAAPSDGDDVTFDEDDQARVDQDSAAADDITLVRLAADGDNVCVVWYNATQKKLFCNFSTDKGLSWDADDVQINDTAITGDVVPASLVVCADGNNVYVCWMDSASTDLSFRASDDGGETWQGADDLILNENGGGAASSNPAMVCNGDTVHIFFTDERNGDKDIFYRRSINGGLSFAAAEVRVDKAPGATHSDNAVACLENAKVWVAYNDQRSGDDVFMQFTSDNGGSFLGADIQVNQSQVTAEDPRIACAEGVVYIVYTGADDKLHLNRTTDGTDVFFDTDRAVETSAADASGGYRIGAVKKNVYVAWDEDDGAVDFNYSRDRGFSFLSSEIEISDDSADAVAGTVRLHPSELACRVTWQDERSANDRVYFQAGE